MKPIFFNGSFLGLATSNDSVESTNGSKAGVISRVGNDLSGWSPHALGLAQAVVLILLTLLLILATVAVVRYFRRFVPDRSLFSLPPKAKTLSRSRLIITALLPPVLGMLVIWGTSLLVAFLIPEFNFNKNSRGVLALLFWLRKTCYLLVIVWFLFRVIAVVEVFVQQWTQRSGKKWDEILAVIAIRASRLILPMIVLIGIIPTLEIPEAYHAILKQSVSLLVIAAVGFIFYQLTETGETAILGQYRVDVKDNLVMRKVQTQVRVLKRVVVVVIVLFTLAMMLMEFDSVRHLGTSLMASAGVAGVVIGFAAQKSIATIVAGIQIAFTQPIRLDDVVIVEGEWGRIEEITMTYVIVLIWDLRRMVVPITYFIEKPFQNWTRINADLLGTVFLYLDYTAPVDSLRREFDKIVVNSRLWDKKVKVLQVTDLKDRVMEIRMLASAANASEAFDLRCEIREKLVAFLQNSHADCLPQVRLMGTVARAAASTPFQNSLIPTPS